MAGSESLPSTILNTLCLPPLQKPTSLQLQVSKSGRSIFSNLSFTFNHLGRKRKICQILLRQMKSDFYLGSSINATSPVTVETSPFLPISISLKILKNSQASKQRKQNYYAATVFQSPMSSIVPVTSSS